MDIKTPNDAATIEVHIEPQFVGVPFSQLLVNPAYPQLKGFVTAVYQAAEGMTANGAYGLATYPWDLTAISNATPTQQKTSLIERLSSATATYACGCGIATAPVSSNRRMLA
ncbi:g6064 [Coccomyxa viridis]|uniref:G6064 protein n=1 Tax=Coccomyxa viridis TaxID=1274662 RepID=A0ABP1G169_9CHLO